MLATEAEASGKWCPLSRVNVTGSNRHKDGGLALEQTRCVGSACMLWRWVARQPFAKARGYCGAGGPAVL
jgi:hypothetical protein